MPVCCGDTTTEVDCDDASHIFGPFKGLFAVVFHAFERELRYLVVPAQIQDKAIVKGS